MKSNDEHSEDGARLTIWYADMDSNVTPSAANTFSSDDIWNPKSLIPLIEHIPWRWTSFLQACVYLLLEVDRLTLSRTVMSYTCPPWTSGAAQALTSSTRNWHGQLTAEPLHTSFDSSNSTEKREVQDSWHDWFTAAIVAEESRIRAAKVTWRTNEVMEQWNFLLK